MSDHRLDDRASIPGRGIWFFLFTPCPGQLWAPPSLLSNAYRGFFHAGKARSERDADRSPPSSAEVESEQELYFFSFSLSHCFSIVKIGLQQFSWTTDTWDIR
jgi:hypothetical protein